MRLWSPKAGPRGGYTLQIRVHGRFAADRWNALFANQ
jgi:hypothetical protein